MPALTALPPAARNRASLCARLQYCFGRLLLSRFNGIEYALTSAPVRLPSLIAAPVTVPFLMLAPLMVTAAIAPPLRAMAKATWATTAA